MTLSEHTLFQWALSVDFKIIKQYSRWHECSCFPFMPYFPVPIISFKSFLQQERKRFPTPFPGTRLTRIMVNSYKIGMPLPNALPRN